VIDIALRLRATPAFGTGILKTAKTLGIGTGTPLPTAPSPHLPSAGTSDDRSDNEVKGIIQSRQRFAGGTSV
jgi:hypothetical protein